MPKLIWNEELGTDGNEDPEVWVEDDGGAVDRLLKRVEALAEELAARPNLGLKAAPLREVERLGEIGLLTSTLPRDLGGLGLTTLPDGQHVLMRLLAAVGGGDLALGRLYEGHVNGLLLVMRYGTNEQLLQLAQDCHAGMLSAVWNTGAAEPLRLLRRESGIFQFEGTKTFATGAAFVRRPIVTAEIAGGGWQMTLVRMEEVETKIDSSFWHPIGMESSESFGIDFTGGRIGSEDLVGQPGDFYRDPLFRGGAVRFAAVQAGAVLRLHGLFLDWLKRMQRGQDPYQVARLGELSILAQEAALWVEKASTVAEQCLLREDWTHAERMVECANMTRVAISRIAARTVHLVTEGVGAHGLLQPERFERIIRDLTMYLRQPAPDKALADVGLSFLNADKPPGARFWSGEQDQRSLTPEYFDDIYTRNEDPWEFKTSAYEAAKYRLTIESLPDQRYLRALEIGCSIGVLTELLASRCDHVLAVDASMKALRHARDRLAGNLGVECQLMRIPQEIPTGKFDLIVVSEVAYYWKMADLETAADKLAKIHKAGGHLVLVHWTPHVHDYPLTGDAVHEYWISRREWRTVRSLRQEKFRLEVLKRV